MLFLPGVTKNNPETADTCHVYYSITNATGNEPGVGAVFLSFPLSSPQKEHVALCHRRETVKRIVTSVAIYSFHTLCPCQDAFIS